MKECRGDPAVALPVARLEPGGPDRPSHLPGSSNVVYEGLHETYESPLSSLSGRNVANTPQSYSPGNPEESLTIKKYSALPNALARDKGEENLIFNSELGTLESWSMNIPQQN